MEWSHGKVKPLEQTRQEWLIEENLHSYFVVARDVLLNAGVAMLNPDFNPAVAYSPEIIIINPERICTL